MPFWVCCSKDDKRSLKCSNACIAMDIVNIALTDTHQSVQTMQETHTIQQLVCYTVSQQESYICGRTPEDS